MRLINWPRLEQLLIPALEDEMRVFGLDHPNTPWFAVAVEFDDEAIRFDLSYGARSDVERAWIERVQPSPGTRYYRHFELHPGVYAHRRLPHRDPEGRWELIEPILAAIRENIGTAEDPHVAAFYHARTRHLACAAVSELVQRGAGRRLRQDDEFLVYLHLPDEPAWQVEMRLQRDYSNYLPAAVGLAMPAHWDDYELSCSRCGKEGADQERDDLEGDDLEVGYCTACFERFCIDCHAEHDLHPERMGRLPLFQSPAESG